MPREVVYLNRDNTVDLQLRADGTAVAMDGVTKIELVLDSATIISSATSPGAFNWDNHKTATAAASRKLILDLGDEIISAGLYYAYLVIYDATNIDGVRWDGLVINVKN